MPSPSFFRRAALGAFVLPLLLACEDRLPTAIGEELFPGGARPTTVELILEPEQYILSTAQYSNFTDAANASFLTVARNFEGALHANGLARFTGFPDTVTYTVGGTLTTVGAFTYQGGTVVTVVNPGASAGVTTRLRLYALEQAWDTAGVSWTVARGRAAPTPWTMPGGTRGALLGEAVWAPGDTAVAADSIRFAIDSLTVARMAAPGFHGLVVTSETEGSRVQLSRLVLQTSVRPAANADTTIALTFTGGPQTTIYTPTAASVPGAFRFGGITGDRAVIGLNLAQQVRACADPATTPNCPLIPLRDVTINQASLVLTPVAAPGGLRSLQAVPARVRRVLEPELGRQAPLGELLSIADTATARRLGAPDGGSVAFDLTAAISTFNAQGMERLTIAVLNEPEGAAFGYVYFTDRPRLRIVYTVPLRPTFP
jgi:hypothetical protein